MNTAGDVLERVDTDTDSDTERSWVVRVYNDDVNTFGIVTLAFRTVFEYPTEKARQHTLEVHVNGSSILWEGERERAEAYTVALQGWGLWARTERSGQ